MENKRLLKKKKILFSYANLYYKVQLNDSQTFFLFNLNAIKKKKNQFTFFWFKYFLTFLYNYEVMYFVKKINQKIFKIFLKKGLKFNAIKSLLNGLISVKYFLHVDNYLLNFVFFNIFKLPLNITKKQKGRKTIIIPEVFNPDKLLNVTIHTFYNSLLKKKRKNFMNNLNDYFFLEFYDSMVTTKDISYFSNEYTTLMFTFLQNRSWMAFQ